MSKLTWISAAVAFIVVSAPVGAVDRWHLLLKVDPVAGAVDGNRGAIPMGLELWLVLAEVLSEAQWRCASGNF